jgi:hypothetical protein
MINFVEKSLQKETFFTDKKSRFLNEYNMPFYKYK